MAQVFYPTASQVIDAALGALAAIDPEGTATPTTTERTNALVTFNYLVTSWQALGMQVWCQKTGSYTLSAANSYTIGGGGTIATARPLAITQAWLRDTATNPVDTPLIIVDRDTYNRNAVKTSVGVPVQLFYDPEYDRDGSNSGANAKGKIYVWPTPDATVVANYDLYFVYTRPIQDFNAVSDTLDFPQWWFNAVKWNLAYQMSFDYGIPIEDKHKLEKLAEKTLELAMSFDVDQQSVYFEPEYR